MQKITLLLLFFLGISNGILGQEKVIARQGQVSFFSYTSVEISVRKTIRY